MAVAERLAWYAARARAMSPGEVAWRLGSKVAPLVPRRPEPVLADGLGWDEAYAGFRAARGRPVLLDVDRAADVAATCPADVAAVIAAADGVLAGRFPFFGAPPVAVPLPVDWNLDVRTGERWPLVPAQDIDHRTHAGDPKWIWELNRLQHLPWLAQAWLVTGEGRYAEAAWEHLDGWVEQNPPGRGIAWRGGFEAGVRALSVAVAVAGLRTAAATTQQRYRRAATMLAASAQAAWRQRSLHSSANNHLLGEVAGVATVAMLHPELASSARALPRAWALLAREAGRQFLPDGANAEQSAAYHVFAAELLLVPAALAGSDAPAAVTAALARSAGYLAAFGDPPPRYGDEDGGFALRVVADPEPSIGRHLAAVAALLGAARPADDLAARWIDAAPAPDHAPAPAGDRHAPEGGLVLLRRGGRRLTMDVGPLGYLAIAAHGHADALAITLSDGGAELVGDPGTGSYYAEPAWRDAFRGTRFHATVTVDDADQSVHGGAFLWTRHAGTTVAAVDLDRGVVQAEHDGYTRLPEPVVHRRYLVAPPGWAQTLVVDLLSGRGAHRFTTSWPLPPDLDLEHGTVTRAGVPVLHIATAATADPRPYAVRGDVERRLGWWSPRFEAREPSWLVGATVETTIGDGEPLVVATTLGPEPVAELTVRRTGALLEVTWVDGGHARSVRIDTARPGAVAYPMEGEH